jgi:SpoVK/Ycf46/Vps4 family AAA+-type ATPase
MRRQSEGQPNNRPRGVLLLAPPGCGKSQFAKALGNEAGRPTVVLDVGALFGSLVGRSGSNVRAARKLADAMAPCVLFADTIESLRQWASGRCLSADRAGVYSRGEVGSGGRGRRVVRADEACRENTKGSRSVMATCSPLVGITLAGAR